MKNDIRYELRLGNYVIAPGVDTNGNRCECIICIQQMDFMKILMGECESKPVEITEDWLINFGFKNDGKEYFFTGFLIERDLYQFNVWVNKDFTKTIQYVHELQNLYFALTGKELELKD